MKWWNTRRAHYADIHTARARKEDLNRGAACRHSTTPVCHILRLRHCAIVGCRTCSQKPLCASCSTRRPQTVSVLAENKQTKISVSRGEVNVKVNVDLYSALP